MRYLLIAAMFVLILSIYSHQNHMQAEEINYKLAENMTQLNDMNKSFSNLKYTNMYEKEAMTPMNAIGNIIYISIQFGMQLGNTIIPMLTYIATGQISQGLTNILIIVGLIVVFLITKWIIEETIIIYFFIKEKKESKNKWYQ